MIRTKDLLQGWAGAALRALSGLAIGELIAVLFWVTWILGNGNSVVDAIQGQVEDGIGTLEGLVALGALVGGPVGLLWALNSISLPRSD